MRLPEDYVDKALRDANRHMGCWDAGTSGSLAAHVWRLIKERKETMGRIEELEAELAKLRGAAPDGLPAGYEGRLKPATPLPQPELTEPIMVSAPPEQIEAAWAGIKARREAMLARIKSPHQPSGSKPKVYGRRRLIGMTGRAGSGKTLAAGMIPGAVVIQLADPLYAALATLLGVPEVLLRDRGFKERPIDWIGKSPRQLLQSLGTEWGRDSVRPDLWLEQCRRRIAMLQEHGVGTIVVADVRFENEASMIREAGGVVWHVRRPAADGAEVAHSSEAGIHFSDGDSVIVNDGTIEQLRVRIDSVISGVAA